MKADSALFNLLAPDVVVDIPKVVGALKPGAHLLALSPIATHHSNTIGIEDAGMEIRDTLAYVFADGENTPDLILVTVARKPLEGTVAENVLRWGTGGLNIDACRVDTKENLNGGAYAKSGSDRYDGDENWRFKRKGDAGEYVQPEGRWPANLTHDNSPSAIALFPSPHGAGHSRGGGLSKDGGSMFCGNHAGNGMRFGDSGSAARFFYSAPTLNTLVAYLLKLVTPPNGTVFTNYNTDNLPEEYNYVTDCGH